MSDREFQTASGEGLDISISRFQRRLGRIEKARGEGLEELLHGPEEEP